MPFIMSMIVVLHEVLLMVILPMLLPLIKEGFFLIKIIPLFDWLAQRPKYFKNYVIKNPELFQDIPDLAEDFDSPICLAYTTAIMVTIFKNVIPCFWQRYSWKLIWSDLNFMLLTKLILKSFKKKMKEFSSCHALLYFDLTMLLLTKSAPKTKIFNSTIDSPCFGDKNEKFTIQSLFTCHYSLSLFIRYCSWHCSLQIFAYLRGVVPYV